MKVGRLMISFWALALLGFSLAGCGDDSSTRPGTQSIEGTWWEVQDSGDDDCIFFLLEGGVLTRISDVTDEPNCLQVGYALEGSRLSVQAGPGVQWPGFSCDVAIVENKMVWSGFSDPEISGGAASISFWRAEDSPNCPGVPSVDCGP